MKPICGYQSESSAQSLVLYICWGSWLLSLNYKNSFVKIRLKEVHQKMNRLFVSISLLLLILKRIFSVLHQTVSWKCFLSPDHTGDDHPVPVQSSHSSFSRYVFIKVDQTEHVLEARSHWLLLFSGRVKRFSCCFCDVDSGQSSWTSQWCSLWSYVTLSWGSLTPSQSQRKNICLSICLCRSLDGWWLFISVWK